jgi:hypothetical protein
MILKNILTGELVDATDKKVAENLDKRLWEKVEIEPDKAKWLNLGAGLMRIKDVNYDLDNRVRNYKKEIYHDRKEESSL